MKAGLVGAVRGVGAPTGQVAVQPLVVDQEAVDPLGVGGGGGDLVLGGSAGAALAGIVVNKVDAGDDVGEVPARVVLPGIPGIGEEVLHSNARNDAQAAKQVVGDHAAEPQVVERL